MVSAEKTGNGVNIKVIGVADDTMTEAAAIIETIVGGCIENHGATFGREAFFDILSRAVSFTEEKTGVNLLDESLDMKTRIKDNPAELLAELLGVSMDDDGVEDDLPKYMF